MILFTVTFTLPFKVHPRACVVVVVVVFVVVVVVVVFVVGELFLLFFTCCCCCFCYCCYCCCLFFFVFFVAGGSDGGAVAIVVSLVLLVLLLWWKAFHVAFFGVFVLTYSPTPFFQLHIKGKTTHSFIHSNEGMKQRNFQFFIHSSKQRQSLAKHLPRMVWQA